MAGSVNKVILVGNLGADPEIRRTQSGSEVASFRIATSESWKDKNTGEKKERTEWHSIVVFNENLVRIVDQYLKKGSKVYIEGAQQTRKWTGQDQIERYTTETVLAAYRGEIQLLDKLPSNRPSPAESPEDYGSARTGERQPAGTSSPANFSRDLDDEIPF